MVIQANNQDKSYIQTLIHLIPPLIWPEMIRILILEQRKEQSLKYHFKYHEKGEH